jgi:hypothetical protein
MGHQKTQNFMLIPNSLIWALKMFQNKVENKKHFLHIWNANAQKTNLIGNTAIQG